MLHHSLPGELLFAVDDAAAYDVGELGIGGVFVPAFRIYESAPAAPGPSNPAGRSFLLAGFRI